jgi:hypothetical protein
MRETSLEPGDDVRGAGDEEAMLFHVREVPSVRRAEKFATGQTEDRIRVPLVNEDGSLRFFARDPPDVVLVQDGDHGVVLACVLSALRGRLRGGSRVERLERGSALLGEEIRARARRAGHDRQHRLSRDACSFPDRVRAMTLYGPGVATPDIAHVRTSEEEWARGA